MLFSLYFSPDFNFEDQVLKGDQPLKKKILPRKAPSLDEREVCNSLLVIVSQKYEETFRSQNV